MDDPNPLQCVGSNHVPGCDHFIFENNTIASGLLPVGVWTQTGPTTIEGIFKRDPLGLTLSVDVTVTRAGRRKCSRCGKLRRLVRLTAYSANQPVGYGEARCLECADLRPR